MWLVHTWHSGPRKTHSTVLEVGKDVLEVGFTVGLCQKAMEYLLETTDQL